MTGGSAPGGSSNDNVLGGCPLQVHGVDEDVEEGGRKGESGAQDVDQGGEEYECGDVGGESEEQRFPWLDALGRHGATACPPHSGVDIPVEKVVQCVRTAGGQRACDQYHRRQPEVGGAAGGQEHAREGREEEKKDYAGLGEGEIVPKNGCQAKAGAFARLLLPPTTPSGKRRNHDNYRLLDGGVAMMASILVINSSVRTT